MSRFSIGEGIEPMDNSLINFVMDKHSSLLFLQRQRRKKKSLARLTLGDVGTNVESSRGSSKVTQKLEKKEEKKIELGAVTLRQL